MVALPGMQWLHQGAQHQAGFEQGIYIMALRFEQVLDFARVQAADTIKNEVKGSIGSPGLTRAVIHRLIGTQLPDIQPIDPLGLTPNVASLIADPELRELTDLRSMAGVDAGVEPEDFGMGDSLVM